MIADSSSGDMNTRLLAGLAAATLLFATLAFPRETPAVSAAGEQPPGPDRYTTVTQEYTKFSWWLARWSDSTIACQLEVEHDGIPTWGEVYAACGKPLYDQWTATPPCSSSSSDPGSCPGYYLHFIKSEAASRQAPVKLPPPIVWVTLNGCIPFASTHRCDDMPTLVLTGEEPLSGYTIQRLEGSVEDEIFTCAPTCQIDLGPTDEDGILVRFWAYSSYGDSSELFEARVRVRGTDDPQDPFWYADILTTQWRGVPQAPCMDAWQKYPPVGLPARIRPSNWPPTSRMNIWLETLSAILSLMPAPVPMVACWRTIMPASADWKHPGLRWMNGRTVSML
jgi:hypothetical protein